MNFKEAYKLLKTGVPIKLKSWKGYWKWEDNSIKMYCKDGRVVDIKDMENVEFTFDNICTDEWEVATKENSIL